MRRQISLPGLLGKKAFYTADIVDFQYVILYNDLHLPPWQWRSAVRAESSLLGLCRASEPS
jgi:hypothetical protein